MGVLDILSVQFLSSVFLSLVYLSRSEYLWQHVGFGQVSLSAFRFSSGCSVILCSIKFLFVRNFYLSGVIGIPLTGDARECRDSKGRVLVLFWGSCLMPGYP